MPELYDFRFGSGVVREDDGVILFLGIMDGEGAAFRDIDVGVSGWGVGGVKGIGGIVGIIESLFILRASVGLIVRAAKPVACTQFGIIDSRLSEEGVPLDWPMNLTGERAAPITGEIVWSGVPNGVGTLSWTSFGGGNRDSAWVFLSLLPAGTSSVWLFSRLFMKALSVSLFEYTGRLLLSSNPGRAWVCLRLRMACSEKLMGSVPGPTDFLGDRCIEILLVDVGK